MGSLMNWFTSPLRSLSIRYSYFEVLVSCCSCITHRGACYGRVDGFWCRHIDLGVNDYLLELLPGHLGLGCLFWPYLCWEGPLFLGFCCPLWILGMHAGCGLSVENALSPSSGVVSHWGSQVEGVARYWGLTRRKRGGLEGWNEKIIR